MIFGIQKVIVVLGMHRSGTSAITRSLELLGVGLGDDLHPAGFDNPKGFWEDRECLEINEELLYYLGSAYDRLDLAWERLKNNPFINKLNTKAKHIIIRKLSENNGLWGFKDPRTCRLLSFWHDVFDSVGCETNYVIVLRNPLSVASSLGKRNNTPFEKSCYLWLQHMLPAVLDSEESPRLVVDYDLLMDAPLKQLFRISEKIRLPILDEDGDAVREYLEDFLDNSLRHTKFSAIDVALDKRVPLDVIGAYQLLLSTSRDESSLESPEICSRFKEIYDRLKAHTPAFSYINTIEVEDERIKIYTSISERDGQITKLNQALSERDDQISRLNHELETLRCEFDKIIHSNSWFITKPLRFLRRSLISWPYWFFRKQISCLWHWCWHHLPVSVQSKQKFKNSLFVNLPFIFGWTQAYNNWRNFNSPNRRIILVSHDAHPHGAQYLILHVAKILVEDFGFVLDAFLLENGALIDDFAKYSTLHLLDGKDVKSEDIKAILADLYAEGVRSAIANTTVAGIFVRVLKEKGFHVVSLIHELPSVIQKLKLQSNVISIAKCADSIVFPAKSVMEGFECFSPVSLIQAVIRPQGLYKKNLLQNRNQIEQARIELRNQLGLPKTAKIVLCVGFANYRKGIDLFVEIGLKVLKRNTKAYFIWVGHFDPAIEPKIIKLVNDSGYSKHFVFPGRHDFKTDLYYTGSDVYALTSREDPFPSVVLESFDANLPVIAFDGTGGITELLSRGGGRLIPAYDTTIFATELIELIRSPKKARMLGKRGKAIIDEEFSMRQYVFDLVAMAEVPLKRVSVILPNYNYANFLAERIMSIVNQDYPIYELIILDDASNDGSIQILNELMPTLKLDCKLITNESNSGNSFVQWLKGIKIARGDYVWIAEASDLSEPEFLSEVLQPFDDPTVVMSYCQSKQLNMEDQILCNDYFDYLRDVSSEKWSNNYINEGPDEIRTALAIKNTIPNVSSVVFERNELFNTLQRNINEIKRYRVVGDWLMYIYVLEQGKIAYSPKPFNLHRRHQNSVTVDNFNLMQLEEIMAIQKTVRQKFSPKSDVIKKAHNYAQRSYEEFELCSPNAHM
ncbi:MAG: glycosyltransferase [Desulfobacterales bacterium]